jgi:hypothetical protein
LRGEAVTWPSGSTSADESAFLEAATAHGVGPLVAHHLHSAHVLATWPDTIREALQRSARVEVVIEEYRHAEVREVLETLARGGIKPLIFKGGAVAHLYYPKPFLRPRCDTDLLIAKDDLNAVSQVMTEREYSPWNLTPGELIMPQRAFMKRHRWAGTHAFDVHWKIVNAQAFAGMLTFEELGGRSIDLPIVGAHARTFSHADALLLACIHIVAHHTGTRRLLWFYDLHLMAQAMDERAFEGFAALAIEKHAAAACASSLRAAQQWFHTTLPEHVLAELTQRGSREPSATYSSRRMRPVDVLKSDLKSLTGVRARLQLLREHLCPPAAYMLARYQTSNRLWLPALYVNRVVSGAWKWFQ